MRIYCVADYVSNWGSFSDDVGDCIAGVILRFRGQLLLMDEGKTPGFYKENKRVILQCEDAGYMLKKVLPSLGGGPSPFWESAIVFVESKTKLGDQYFVTPKKIHYWDVSTSTFVPLDLDASAIEVERAKEAKLHKARQEIEEAGETDPFASAGEFYDSYWSERL